MTDLERATVEAFAAIACRAVRLVTDTLARLQAGQAVDVTRMEAEARALVEAAYRAEDVFEALRPDGTAALPPTVH